MQSDRKETHSSEFIPSDLTEAAENGDVQAVREIISQRKAIAANEAKPLTVDDKALFGRGLLDSIVWNFDYTYIHKDNRAIEQVRKQYLEIIDLLIENGAEVNINGFHSFLTKAIEIYKRHPSEDARQLMVRFSNAGSLPRGNTLSSFIKNEDEIRHFEEELKQLPLDAKTQKEITSQIKPNLIKYHFGDRNFDTESISDLACEYGDDWVYSQLLDQLRKSEALHTLHFQVLMRYQRKRSMFARIDPVLSPEQWEGLTAALFAKKSIKEIHIYEMLSFLKDFIPVIKKTLAENKDTHLESLSFHGLKTKQVFDIISAVNNKQSISRLHLENCSLESSQDDEKEDDYISRIIPTLPGLTTLSIKNLEMMNGTFPSRIIHALENSNSITRFDMDAIDDSDDEDEEKINIELSLCRKMAEYNHNKQQLRSLTWAGIAFAVSVARAADNQSEARIANAAIRDIFPYLIAPALMPNQKAGLHAVMHEIHSLLPEALRREVKLEVHPTLNKKGVITITTTPEISSALSACLNTHKALSDEKNPRFLTWDEKNGGTIHHPKELWARLTTQKMIYKKSLDASLSTLPIGLSQGQEKSGGEHYKANPSVFWPNSSLTSNLEKKSEDRLSPRL